MIGALVAWSLRRRVIVLALLVVFVAAGVLAFKRLPVEAYPDVTNVQVQIITLFAGHAAEEVERLVTIPVENEMNGIPKRASMRSISIFGLSVVTIVFEDDADRAYVRNQAFERLQSVALPQGAQANLSPDSTPVGEIYRYTVTGPPGISPLTGSSWSRPHCLMRGLPPAPPTMSMRNRWAPPPSCLTLPATTP